MTVPDVRPKIRDYINIFFQRKRLFFIPFIAVFIVTMFISCILPNVYRAVVKVEVLSSPIVGSYDISAGVRQQLGILRERLFSQSLLEAIARKVLPDSEKDQASIEKLVSNLRRNVEISMAGNQLIIVSYDGQDKSRVVELTKVMAQALIEESFKKRDEEANRAVDFIRSELEHYQEKLDDKSEIYTANPRVKYLRDRLFDSEEQLAELSIHCTEQHPLVIGLKKDIEDTRGELKKLNNGQKLDEQRLNEIRLERKIRLNETLYGQLLSQLEVTRLSQRLKEEEQRTKFRIIDLDNIPVYAIAPDKIKMRMSGLILGIFFGIGLICVAEFSDHSLKGIDDSKQHLKLPILGMIPKIDLE